MHLTSTVQLIPHLAQDEAITSSHTVELSLSCSLHAAKQKMIKSVGGAAFMGYIAAGYKSKLRDSLILSMSPPW